MSTFHNLLKTVENKRIWEINISKSMLGSRKLGQVSLNLITIAMCYMKEHLVRAALATGHTGHVPGDPHAHVPGDPQIFRRIVLKSLFDIVKIKSMITYVCVVS